MALATGIFKKLAYKRESSWGVAAGTSGATYLRRVQSTIDMTRDPFQSNEIRPTQQVADFRLGLHRVGGTIDGEVSGGTYSDFWAGLLRRDFTTGVTATASDITASAGPPGTFVSVSSINWLTSGFKVGDVVRCSGWTTTATGNNARNYRITALTATTMTVGTSATGAAGQPEAVIAKASGDSVTIAVIGKKTWIPISGHTDTSFTIEHWHSDINQSEYFVGCKVAQADIQLPATGMATNRFAILGKDIVTGTSQYFSSPGNASSGTVYAAVNGSLRIGGIDVGIVTGASISINGNLSVDPVVGSNYPPAVFPGRINVSGQMTAFFQDGVLRDYFVSENEVSMTLVMTQNTNLNSDFIVFNLPRLKLGGAQKNDTDKGLVQTIPFTALENVNGGAGINSELTTISIQDSLA